MKLSKWLTPILTSSLAIASGGVGLVGCSSKPKQPEIETFEVQFTSDDNLELFTFSNKIATIGDDFVTTYTYASTTRTITKITITANGEELEVGQYEIDNEAKTIIIFKEHLLSKNIVIDFQTQPIATTFNVEYEGTDHVNPSETVAVIGQDFITDFAVITPSKILNTITVQSGATTFTEGIQYTINGTIITVKKEYLGSKQLKIIFTTTNYNPTQFIYDRTFSLLGTQMIRQKADPTKYAAYWTCLGTGWIIDDATPSNHEDYKYHVATNWHVTSGFADLESKSVPSGYEFMDIWYWYGDLSCASEYNIIDAPNDYIQLGGAAKGYYKEEQDPSTFVYSGTNGIDLYETDIDFKSAYSDVPSASIKTKLDIINRYRIEHTYINKFVEADDTTIQAKDKYIGGYPAKESEDESVYGGKWETHLVESGLKYKTNLSHDIGSCGITDISPQYESTEDMGSDWMSGGASGSMLLTEDCEICGIYWGGFGSMYDPAIFYPSFSLFNISNKNFLSKYIH